MKQAPDEIMITRWIDGDLPANEAEAMDRYAAENPELLELKQHSVAVGRGLKESCPAEQEMPYAEFFQSQLMRRIERESAEVPVASEGVPSFWEKVSQWFAPAAVAGMALCFYLGTQLSGNDASGSAVFAQAELYTPDDNVKAEFIEGQAGQPAVIVLTGLEAIPDTVELVESEPPVGDELLTLAF